MKWKENIEFIKKRDLNDYTTQRLFIKLTKTFTFKSGCSFALYVHDIELDNCW